MQDAALMPYITFSGWGRALLSRCNFKKYPQLCHFFLQFGTLDSSRLGPLLSIQKCIIVDKTFYMQMVII